MTFALNMDIDEKEERRVKNNINNSMRYKNWLLLLLFEG